MQCQKWPVVFVSYERLKFASDIIFRSKCLQRTLRPGFMSFAVDNSCHGSGGSRRSSRAAAATRSRHSSVTSALLRQQANMHPHRKSTDTAISLDSGSRSTGRRRFTAACGDVPGIEISRIDTLDFDDGSLMATCSGKHGYGGGTGSRQRFIFINRSARNVMHVLNLV